MGDQRRRSKSRGCQKEQEEGEERVGGCVRVYTEWVWPLFTVHSGEGKRGQAGDEDGGGGREVQEAEQRKKTKEANDR